MILISSKRNTNARVCICGSAVDLRLWFSYVQKAGFPMARLTLFMAAKNRQYAKLWIQDKTNQYKSSKIFYIVKRVFLARGGGGGSLVNCVSMREQRTAKLTLNSVFDISKLIPHFTISSQKVTLSM